MVSKARVAQMMSRAKHSKPQSFGTKDVCNALGRCKVGLEEVSGKSLRGMLDELGSGFVSITFYASLLKQCSTLGALEEGRRVHDHIARSRHERGDIILWNLLIQMYGKCGSLEDAWSVYGKMKWRNVFTGNIMIATCSQCGDLQGARRIFDTMPERNVITWNTMIGVYLQSGNLQDARSVFDEMSQRNVGSWNAIIAAYAQRGSWNVAFKLFENMISSGMVPDEVTFISVLEVCASQAALVEGQHIHDEIVRFRLESNVVVGTALVNMYGKCRRLEDAIRVFNKMEQRDVVGWTAMIAAFSQCGHMEGAERIFRQMPERNVVSWNSMISAYAQCGNLEAARKTFNEMPRRNVASWNSMIAAYAQFGRVEDAQKTFDEMPERNVVSWNAMVAMHAQHGSIHHARATFDATPRRNIVSWNAMIAGYGQYGAVKEALQLFKELQQEGIVPNDVTYAGIIDACANGAALLKGKEIHKYLQSIGFDENVVVGSALVNMYGKCGSLEEARRMFDGMSRRNVVSWNVMIGAYSQYGHGKDAVQCFHQMKKEGMVPYNVTLVNLLNACSHAGLIDEGFHNFTCVNRDHGIALTLIHHDCMIDLLGRIGKLDKAEDLINCMMLRANRVTWMALLGASRSFHDVERAKRAAEHVLEFSPFETTPTSSNSIQLAGGATF